MLTIVRCFPHIVNIAVQAVLSSVTNMEYAKGDAEHFNPTWNINNDIIASLRTLINKVCIFCCNDINNTD